MHFNLLPLLRCQLVCSSPLSGGWLLQHAQVMHAKNIIGGELCTLIITCIFLLSASSSIFLLHMDEPFENSTNNLADAIGGGFPMEIQNQGLSVIREYQAQAADYENVMVDPVQHQYDMNRAYAMIAWYDPSQGKEWNVYYMRTLHIDIGRRGKQPSAVDCTFDHLEISKLTAAQYKLHRTRQCHVYICEFNGTWPWADFTCTFTARMDSFWTAVRALVIQNQQHCDMGTKLLL